MFEVRVVLVEDMVAAWLGSSSWKGWLASSSSTAAWRSLAKRVQASNEPSKSEMRSQALGFSLHCFCSSNADFSLVHRGFQLVVHELAVRVRETQPSIWFPVIAVGVPARSCCFLAKACSSERQHREVGWSKAALEKRENNPLVSLISSAGSRRAGEPFCTVSELMPAGHKKEGTSQQGICQCILHCGNPPFLGEIIRELQFEKCL